MALLRDGQGYREGEIIDIDDAREVSALRDAGAVEVVAAPDAPACEVPTVEEVRSEVLMEALRAMADDSSLKLKNGYPKVSALEAASGLDDVTAAERDAVWERYLTLPPQG